MKGIYNFSVLLFRSFLILSGKFSSKNRKLVRGRSEIFPSLTRFVGGNDRKICWFHVASLGEYEQAKPVIRAFKSRYPEAAIVLTFFSPSGYEHVVKKPQPHLDLIIFLPFDTPKNAGEFVNLLNPAIVFFVKYDLWPNFIFAVKQKNIPLFLFSASFRQEQIYFRKHGGFFRKVLFAFDHIFAQNQQTMDLLKAIDYGSATLTGDTRFDNVYAISQNPKHFPLIGQFKQQRPLVVAGSVWEEDMELLIPAIEAFPQYKFIIAPHDIHEKTIRNWQSRIHRPSITYSALEKAGHQGEEVLFIDNIGMLSSLYQYARVAYVGGAFGKGLHNILEALAFEIPVCFGELKRKSKFPEAGVSQAYGCGFEVKDTAGLQRLILQFEDEETYDSACRAAGRMVKDNLGSADGIMDQVQKITGKL